jgi:hypothetical protein
MATQTLPGSCHCGAVKFEIQADPDQGTGTCNCTFCTKTALWSLRPKSPQQFKLLSGADDLGDYSKSGYGHHRFCKRCGLWTHTHGSIPQAGGDYVSVNVRALDVDLALFEGKPLRYVDGRANTWEVLKTEPYHSQMPKSRGQPLPYGQMPKT